MVKRGAEAPHQLPGTAGGIPSLQMLFQRQTEHPCPSEDGQHLSNSLHQQDGRDGVPNTEQIKQGILALVHGERYLGSSSAPGRCPELHSRRRVQSDEGQNRLDALPKEFPDHQPSMGTTGSGPLCLMTLDPTPNLCELETRPRSNGHGCFHRNLDGAEGICQPPVEFSGKGVGPSPTTESSSDLSSPSMEDTDLVSSVTGDVHRPATDHAQRREPDSADTSTINAGSDTTTSRVEYLRRQYEAKELSEEAIRLMLTSWREKSSKSYES